MAGKPEAAANTVPETVRIEVLETGGFKHERDHFKFAEIRVVSRELALIFCGAGWAKCLDDESIKTGERGKQDGPITLEVHGAGHGQKAKKLSSVLLLIGALSLTLAASGCAAVDAAAGVLNVLWPLVLAAPLLLPLAMAKSVHDDVLDGAWAVIQDNCTRITVCSSEPTTYTEGNSTFALADVTVDDTDFAMANGDTSGRKITVSAQSAVPIDTSGTAQHIALLDVANTKLLYVTTCTSQVLTSGNTVNIPAWDAEIADPA